MVGVVGAAAGSAAAGSSGSGYEHRVKAGETLTSIAQRCGVTIDALVRANHLDDANQIVVGTEIEVPSSSTARSPSSSASTSSSSSSGSMVLSGAGTVVEAAPFLTLSPWRQALISGELRRAAREFHVSSSLLKALTYTESRWQQDAVSSTGAVGIGQIMPSTAVWLSGLMGEPGLNPYVRQDNIRMSAFLLRFLLDHTGGRTAALAAYYQGLGAVATVGVSDLGASYAQIISSRRLWFS
jgi:murein DD-endopeptidase MepM/ murein hydrolase activator NlpD